MHPRRLLLIPVLALAGCASLAPPPAEQLAQLPVVTYPERPAAGDYVYRLPAGQPIQLRVRVDGSALARGADQEISASLARDIYLHKGWASEDGRNWRVAEQLVGVKLSLALPSYETPRAGELHLQVERRTPQ